jgi:hypothetical protein
MIAAFLLWSGHRKCAMDAMELFTFRRTQKYDPEAGIDEGVALGVGLGGNKKQPNRGVDGPSQQRFLFYLEAMLYQGIQAFHFLFFWHFFFWEYRHKFGKSACIDSTE